MSIIPGKKKSPCYSFLKMYSVASFLFQRKLKTSRWTLSPARCLYPCASPLLLQLTGLYAVSGICQTAPYPRALCAPSVWSIHMSTSHLSASHLCAIVTCSVRLSFLHSPIERCNFFLSYSSHLPASSLHCTYP